MFVCWFVGLFVCLCVVFVCLLVCLCMCVCVCVFFFFFFFFFFIFFFFFFFFFSLFVYLMYVCQILEDHLFQWPLPENYSLDEDVQAQHVLAFAKEKEDKEQVMKAAERKLLAAQMQLKTAKLSGNSSVDAPNTTVMLSPTPVHHSDQQKSDQKGDQPSKRKKSPVQEVFLK